MAKKHKGKTYYPLHLDAEPSCKTRSGRPYIDSSINSRSASPPSLANVDFPLLRASGLRAKSVDADGLSSVNLFGSLNLSSILSGTLPLSDIFSTRDLPPSILSPFLGRRKYGTAIDVDNSNGIDDSQSLFDNGVSPTEC